jgi:hypothetical protein
MLSGFFKPNDLTKQQACFFYSHKGICILLFKYGLFPFSNNEIIIVFILMKMLPLITR